MTTKFNRKRLVPLATHALLPLIALVSVHFWPRSKNVLQLEVVRIERGDLLSAVTATGTVQAHRTVDIKYDTQSLVTHLDVQEGDHVRQNQSVATMDLRLLAPARAEAMQTLQKDQASLALAEASLHRAQALAAAQVLARADLETSEASYKSLLHQTEVDRGAIALAEEQISRAQLRSPIRGVVIALYVHEGEMLGSATAVAGIGPSSAVSKPTNTLMTIAEEKSLEVDADVNAVDLSGASVGQQADFTLDAVQGRVFHGIVKSIALQPTVTSGVTTYRVILSTPSESRDFRIGMPSNIMLFRTIATDALLVPPTSILRDGSRAFLFLISTTPLQADGLVSRNDRTLPVKMQKIEVQVLGETLTAVAIRANLVTGSRVLASVAPQLSDQTTLTANLSEIPFHPNPTLSDLQFERKTGSTPETTTAIPGPKAKSFLQHLFNP
jgi:HlyD family secretion protein